MCTDLLSNVKMMDTFHLKQKVSRFVKVLSFFLEITQMYDLFDQTWLSAV